MWLLLSLLILTPEDLHAVVTEYEEIEDDLASSDNYTYNESDAEIHSKIHQTFQHYRKCRSDNEWSCDKNCRLEFLTETKKCRNPDPDDNCFGIPIIYKYSRDFHVQRFPRELAVLNRYPKCWSHLAPLICATIYRPCSRHFFIEKDNNGEVKDGTIELWQLLSASQCESVHQACDAVVSSHILSTYTQCENPKHSRLVENIKSNRPLYSTSCQFASDQLPVPVKSGTCAWPLVSTQSHSIHHDSSPVVDECFLPCRSILVPPSLASRFRSTRFIICLIFTVVFVAESVYLSRFSKVFSENLLVFYVSHAMMSVSVYFLVWSVPVFDYFFALSECSVDGISRRYAISHSALEWCSLQSLVLYTSFIAAFTWLFALYTYTVCHLTLVRRFFPARLSRVNVRGILVLSIYGFSVILALVMNSTRENDGVTGVCYCGLITWWKYFVSVFPLVCLLVVVVCIGIFALSKMSILMETVENREAGLALNKAEEGEYHRCEAAQSSEHNENVVKSESEVIANKAPSSNAAPTDVNRAGRLVDLNSDWKRAYNGLLSKESLQELCDKHFTASCEYLQKRTTPCRSSELSKWWSVTSFGFATLFLIAAPAVHYRYTSFPSEDYEARSIVDYVSCGTAHAITNRSIDWTADKTWPSSSTVAAPWCTLPLNEALARMDGVLIVFILLPAMPFLVLFVAFIAGLNGYGGMTLVRRRRDDVSDPLLRKGKAEHFQLLPTEMKEQTTAVKALPLESESVPRERDENEDGASSNSLVRDGLSPNTLEETEADDEGLTKLNTGDGKKCFKVESQTEEHQKVWTIINQLRGELVFQQSMLVNDSAAWNICLHLMRKMEQTLSQLNPQMSPTSAAAQGLRTLTEEMSHILPTVSDHAIQLSRWMQSVQHACLKLERISVSSTNSDLHSCFESQDINRQQNLLALNNYLLACQAATISQQNSSATCPEKEPCQQIKTCSGPSTTEQYQSNLVERTQQSVNVELSASGAVPNPECVAQPGTSQQHQPIVQNGPVAHLPSHVDDRLLPNSVANEPERLSGSAGSQPQAQQPQRVPRISAYAVSYSATPRGFLSRLTVPELRIRIEQIRNICAGDVLYPQELSYMLLASGDIIYAGNQPEDGFYLYTIEQMPELFGTRVPTIDVRIGVQAFLSHMRRRALTVVGAVGYHFSLRPRRGTDYTPPVLPPLGLYRSENELTLRRVLGDSDDILPLIRDFLREYNFGRGPINSRPDLKFASAFRRYLCLVAAREGFNNEVHEDYVPDPEQPAEPLNGGQENSHDSSAEESDPPAPS